MLAIARCLMMRPKLIILDEPTEGIMPRLVSQIRREIHRINQTGVSILLVEQNVETALKLCPRVFLMEKGTIVYAGTSHELKSQPEIVHRYLGLSKSSVIQACLGKETDHEQRKVSRRSFLETRSAGGALAGTANLTIMKDLFAQASGPDRDRSPLRSDRRDLVVGLLARQGGQGRGRHHQQGRRHRRPQGRARRPKTPNPIRRPARASCATSSSAATPSSSWARCIPA